MPLPAPVSPDHRREPAFVGRDTEFGALERASVRALEAGPVTVVIGGEAGVGKTRLLKEFLDHPAGDVHLLLGHCDDLGSTPLPYRPFVEIVRRLAREGVPGLPDLDPLLRALRGEAGEGGFTRAQVVEWLLSLLERLDRDRPVILVLEDLHWSDRSTLDVLRVLISTLSASRVLILVTYREDGVADSDPLRTYLAELARHPGVRQLSMPPLDRQEIGLVVRDLWDGEPPAPVAEEVWQRSGGNPFYAQQIVSVVREDRPDELPEGLTALLLGRIRQLSPDGQRLVALTSAGGSVIRYDAVAAAWPGAPEELDAALREVLDVRILRPVTAPAPDSYRFGHALLQEVGYRHLLLPSDRRRVHSRWAAAVRATTTGNGAGHPTALGELAHHHLAAQEFPEALRACAAAAGAYAAAGGWAESAQQAQAARDLWGRMGAAECEAARAEGVRGRAELVEDAAEAWHLAGEYVRAADLLEAELRLVQAATSPVCSVPDSGLPRSAVLLERLARTEWALGRSDDARRHLERARLLVAGLPASAARAGIIATHAESLRLDARHGESAEHAEEALAVAREVSPPDPEVRAVESRALRTLGSDLVALGRAADGVRVLRESLEAAETLGDPDTLISGYRELATAFGGPLADPVQALRVVRQGIDAASRLGVGRQYNVSLRAVAADAMFRNGRWDEADVELEAAASHAPAGLAGLELYLARLKISLGRGRFEEAHRDLSAARALAAGIPDPQVQVPLATLTAGLALWEGRAEAAAVAVEEGLARLDGTDDVWFAAPLYWHGLRAQADRAEQARRARLGQVAALAVGAARDLLAGFEALTPPGDVKEQVRATFTAYDAMCRAELSRAEAAPEPELWERAASSWVQAGQPYPAMYARLRTAESRLAPGPARGARTTAATVVREVHATAAALGAVPLADMARQVAARAGIGLEASADGARPAVTLTRRETQVFELVAEGRSNREIAERLYISERTVSVHVSNGMAKLGARSRTEAVVLLQRRQA